MLLRLCARCPRYWRGVLMMTVPVAVPPMMSHSTGWKSSAKGPPSSMKPPRTLTVTTMSPTTTSIASPLAGRVPLLSRSGCVIGTGDQVSEGEGNRAARRIPRQPAGPPALPAGWSSRSSPSSSVRWCLGSSARPACARNSRDGAGVTLDPVLQIFFDEAEELLRTFEDGVLGLEQAPADRECLHSIFRAAHTLKGNSSMLGFERIAIVTHALEELLVRLRGGESAPSRSVIDALLSANDVLGTLVARARAHDDSDVPGVGALIDMLADHAQSVGHAASSPHLPARATAHEEEALYAIRFEPPVDLLRRGLDPLRLMDALSSLGEMSDLGALASAVPPLAELDPEGSYLFFECRLRTRVPRSEIEACFEFVDKPGAVHIEALEGGEDADVHVPAVDTGDGRAAGAPREEPLDRGRDAVHPCRHREGRPPGRSRRRARDHTVDGRPDRPPARRGRRRGGPPTRAAGGRRPDGLPCARPRSG